MVGSLRSRHNHTVVDTATPAESDQADRIPRHSERTAANAAARPTLERRHCARCAVQPLPRTPATPPAVLIESCRRSTSNGAACTGAAAVQEAEVGRRPAAAGRARSAAGGTSMPGGVGGSESNARAPPCVRALNRAKNDIIRHISLLETTKQWIHGNFSQKVDP